MEQKGKRSRLRIAARIEKSPKPIGTQGFWTMVPVAGLDLHFRPGMGENKGVAAVETGGKRQSTGLSYFMGSSPSPCQIAKRERPKRTSHKEVYLTHGRGELCSPAGDRRSPLRISKI